MACGDIDCSVCGMAMTLVRMASHTLDHNGITLVIPAVEAVRVWVCLSYGCNGNEIVKRATHADADAPSPA